MFRRCSFLAIVIFAGMLASWSAIAAPEKVDAPGIENFTLLDGPSGFAGPLAGFGGATNRSAMFWLKRNGFTTVINLRLASEEGADIDGNRAAAAAAGLNYIHLPFNARDPEPAVVDDFLVAIGDRQNQPVYIHCNSATRVAALWMIMRVDKDGWKLDAAQQEVELIAKKPAEAIAFATVYLASQAD